MPKDASVDGIDASAAWLGTPMQRGKPLLWEYGRQPDYLFPHEPGARSPNLAIREGYWKLLVNADGTGAELYDLAADPNETRNRAGENALETDRLRAAVSKWRRTPP
jgi:arylsulfatase A-like enzyme